MFDQNSIAKIMASILPYVAHLCASEIPGGKSFRSVCEAELYDQDSRDIGW